MGRISEIAHLYRNNVKRNGSIAFVLQLAAACHKFEARPLNRMYHCRSGRLYLMSKMQFPTQRCYDIRPIQW